MRWLLLKDLQILKRSPLLTALLVIYPIVLAVLIGFAVSRDSDKPRVAFFNEIEAEQSDEGLELGEGGFSQEQAFDQLCERVECVDTDSRDEAIKKVEEGEVLAALVLPEDFLDKLQSQLGGAGLDPAEVEVYVNEDDPIKARPGGRPHQRPDHRGEPDPLRRDLGAAARLPGHPGRGRRVQRALPGRDDRRARPGADPGDPEGGQGGAERAPARGRRRRDPVRRPGGREPRLRRRAAGLGRRSRSRSRRRSSRATCRRSTPSRSRSRSRSR